MKHNMKCIALIMSIVMLIVNCNIGGILVIASTNNSNRVYSEEITVAGGEQFEVPVMIEGNTGMMGFDIVVNYNSEYITPVSVKNGDIFTSGTFDNTIGMVDDKFSISWAGSGNVSEDGTMFTIVFNASDGIVGTSSFTIDLSYVRLDTFDEDYNDVVLNCEDIVVKIDGVAEAPTQTPKVSVTESPEQGERRCTLSYPDMDIKPGNVVSIPISIDRNGGLLGFDVVVTYDSSIFTPISVDSGEVILSNSYLMSNINRSKDNTFRVIWAGIDEVSATGNLFNINMKVKEDINVTSAELKMEYISEGTFDGDYRDVIVDFNYGTFMLDKNAPQITPEPTREPEILDPDEKNKTQVKIIETEGIVGEMVEVPIVLAGERGFVNLAFEVGYDSSVLTLVDVKNDKNVGGVFTKSQYYTVNPYVMIWNSLSEMSYSGTIATLVFEINEDAQKGEYPITVDYYKGNDGSYIDGISINYDENDEPLDMVYSDAVIKVSDYMAGDINGDGKVNNHDATTMLRYLADWDITVNTRALDVNGDGTINNHDATILLRYLAGWDVNIQKGVIL